MTPCDSPQDGQASALDAILDFCQKVLPLRANACDQALYHVHSRPEGDDWLVVQFRKLHSEKRFDCMRDLISLRLRNLFEHRNVPDAGIARIIDCRLANRERLGSTQTISEVESCAMWSDWLQVFRAVLDDLVGEYGLPDSGFSRADYIGPDAWGELDGTAP